MGCRRGRSDGHPSPSTPWRAGQLAAQNKDHGSASTAAYSKARQRLKVELITEAHKRVLDSLGEGETIRGFAGHTVQLVDATTISAADTPDNQESFPQSSQCAPGCGFPLIRPTALFNLNTGAIEKSAVTDCGTSEVTAAICDLVPSIHPGAILVGDRAYGNYGIYSQLHKQGSFFVMRTTDQRIKNYLNLEPDQHGDRIVRLKRPQNKNEAWGPEHWRSFPAEQHFRLLSFHAINRSGKRQKYHLLTNLTDKKKYPPHAVAALYQRRWQIETGFRELKCLLGLDRLRTKSAAMVEKDISLSFIAYNLIRYLHRHAISEADPRGDTTLWRLSFKGSLDTLKSFVGQLHQTRRQPRKHQALMAALITLILKDLIPIRPGRNEPRKRKHRNRGKEWLTQSRAAWKMTHNVDPEFKLMAA